MRKINSIIDSIHCATAQAMVFDDNAWLERRLRLEQIPSITSRLAFLAIHHASRANPGIVKSFLIRDYEAAGYEVLGIGRSSTVIRMDDDAVKIMRSTANFSETDKQRELKKLDFSQKILLSRMSDYALTQTFGIIDHPVRSGDVVVAKQPVVDNFKPIEINNLDALSGLSLKQRSEVKRFTDDALSMTHETGWSPDVLGASNFGFTNDNSLILLDTIPLNSDGARKSTIKYLEQMSQAATDTAYFV